LNGFNGENDIIAGQRRTVLKDEIFF